MLADLMSKDFEASGLPMILGNMHEDRRATTWSGSAGGFLDFRRP